MKEFYNAYEVFELAQQIERNGARFYRKAAEAAEDTSLRQLLLELASMEDDHLRVFQALQERLRDRDWAKGFDPEAEAVLFLRAMATGKVFDVRTDPSELIKMMSPRDTLAMAIGFEKDSIAYYTGVKAIVPEDLGRQEIEHIIAEEMRHAALLSRRLQELEG